MSDDLEQLRRLKNTIMGVSHRLTLVARAGNVPDADAASLLALAADLQASAQRLERLLASLRRRR